MSRRDDWQTSDVDGAAVFERHHGVEELPASHGITLADVEPARPEPCDGVDCGHWVCEAFGRWAG